MDLIDFYFAPIDKFCLVQKSSWMVNFLSIQHMACGIPQPFSSIICSYTILLATCAKKPMERTIYRQVHESHDSQELLDSNGAVASHLTGA